MMRSHRKIVIEPSTALGASAFADYYRYGSAEQPPMICFIGGAITPSEYARRRHTEPLPLVSAFECAWQSGCPAVDLLILSAPPSGPQLLNERLSRTCMHLLFELLPQTDNARPPALGFLGNSYGAHLAGYLTFSLAPALALATVAGRGMSEGARAGTLNNTEGKRCQIYSNLNDGTSDEDAKCIRFLEERGVSYHLDRREGGHAFDDYVQNGSVQNAFQFLLEAIL